LIILSITTKFRYLYVSNMLQLMTSSAKRGSRAAFCIRND